MFRFTLFPQASVALVLLFTSSGCFFSGNAPEEKKSEATQVGRTSPATPAPAATPSRTSTGPTTSEGTTLAALPTDPSYRLTIDDHININVYGEPDLSIAQRIDARGFVRLPLAGDINLVSKSVREAETYLEAVLVEKKLLQRPMVNISIVEYAPREVSVLGAVASPGKFRFPKEYTNMEIVDVITGLGGFRPTGKADQVQVTRFDSTGKEVVLEVDVESMITGRGSSRAPKSFLVYPGDRIYVPERLF